MPTKTGRVVQQQGFTLVELLTVILLLSITVGAIYAVFVSGVRTYRTVQLTSTVQAQANIGLRLLSNELHQAVGRPEIRDAQGHLVLGVGPAFVGGFLIIPTSHGQVQFTTDTEHRLLRWVEAKDQPGWEVWSEAMGDLRCYWRDEECLTLVVTAPNGGTWRSKKYTLTQDIWLDG